MINSMMLIPLYEIWLNEKTKLSPRSIKAYVRVAGQFLKTSTNLKDHHTYMQFLIDTAIKKRNYQNVSAMIMFIKYHFNDEKERNTLINNIKKLNIRPKPSNKYIDKKPLTEDELNSVLAHLEEPKHRVMSLIMYFTGLRIGDILNIRKGGIYYESEGTDKVMKIKCMQKGDKPRIIWMWNKDVAKIIYDFIHVYNSNSEYYFVDYDRVIIQKTDDLLKAQHFNYFKYWEDLKLSLTYNNIDKSRFAAHSFRRDFAKRVWYKFKDIDTLKKLMGHSDVRTSLIYLQQHGYDTAQAMKDFQLG